MPQRQRPYLVFPDVEHFRQVLELFSLRDGHARGEAVEAVPVAVDLVHVRTEPGEHTVLFGNKLCCIGLDRGTLAVEAHPALTRDRRDRGGLQQVRMMLCCRRSAQLHDVDSGRVRLLATGEWQGHRARVAQRRLAFREDAAGQEQQRNNRE